MALVDFTLWKIMGHIELENKMLLTREGGSLLHPQWSTKLTNASLVKIVGSILMVQNTFSVKSALPYHKKITLQIM